MILMKKILILITFLSLASCIGVVEDKNPEETLNAKTKDGVVTFSGISNLSAVSNDKLEVYFYPQAGNQENYAYQIYINGGSVPLEVKGSSLKTMPSGEMVYVLDGLIVNSEYQISVGVKDLSTGVQSNRNNSLRARTFSNFTADFDGISYASPLDGTLGASTIKVEWVRPEPMGSQFFPGPLDPIGYEVLYMKTEDGSPYDLRDLTNPLVRRSVFPSPIDAATQLSMESSRDIGGLAADTSYYFMVRAIHEDYLNNKSIPGYQYEQNNMIFVATTYKEDRFIDWDSSSLVTKPIAGPTSLNEVDLMWSKADGPFLSYRVYTEKIGDPTDDFSTLNPASIDDAWIDARNIAVNYSVVNASDISFRVLALESYAHYRSIVVVCSSVSCGQDSRIVSNERRYTVTPTLTPFNGIKSIESPSSLSTINQITLKFDAPVTNMGYINELQLDCHETSVDTTPDTLDVSTPSVSGKASCTGLERLTLEPANLSQYSGLTEIKVKGSFFAPGQTLSNLTYCFSLNPQINSAYGTISNESNRLVRCSKVKIEVPDSEDFTGVDLTCTPGDDNIPVTWQPPSQGIYTNYEIYIKESDGSAFRYEEAKSGAAGYTTVTGLTSATLAHDFTGLVPGRTYEVGALTYVEPQCSDNSYLTQVDCENNGAFWIASKIYSEANPGVLKCKVPEPTADFVEWADVLAVGRKADGRVPETGNGKKYLFETLTLDGRYLEVDVVDPVLGDYNPTTSFTNQFHDISQAVQFDGIYGTNNGTPQAGVPIAQYSNSGIVKIVWKDMVTSVGGKTINDLVSDYNDAAGLKRDRKIGYRVYRSEDNKNTWIDLTENSDFQTTSNKGLIHPRDYSERTSPNKPLQTFKAGMFVDYSLKSIRSTEVNTENGRIIYYKVVPVFNDEELSVNGANVFPENIIKVILPPDNMAFVHRIIANRQVCSELGKTYSTSQLENYSCDYNGLGSKGRTIPAVIGTTVYDLGSHLLLDRYELGCNVTRGDFSNVNSDYDPTQNYDFTESDLAGFVGCVGRPQQSTIANNDTGNPGVGNSYTSFEQFMKGDCSFTSSASLKRITDLGSCNTRNILGFHYGPGMETSLETNYNSNCSDPNYLRDNRDDPYASFNHSFISKTPQSEYMAVGYNRIKRTSYAYHISEHAAANGAPTNTTRIRTATTVPSSCFINIPVKSESTNPLVGGGRIKPRWISANDLSKITYDPEGGSRTEFSILDKTVREILDHNMLYDLTENLAPSFTFGNRVKEDKKIAKIISSNNAKLPPLTSVSQEDATTICNQYEVEIGVLDSSGNFVRVGEKKSKRLMRRTEGVLAGAWPKTFDDTVVDGIESGVNVENPTTSGVSFNSGCNVYDRAIVSGQNTNQGDGMLMTTLYPYSNTGTTSSRVRPPVITGSSFVDPGGDTVNTQTCTSRYGVQDLVGNVQEVTSEKLFCDFSQDTLKFGIAGDPNNSINYERYPVQYDTAVGAPWVYSTTDTGGCSMTEQGGNLTAISAVGGVIRPIFDIFGNVDSSLVLLSNSLDFNSIEDYRNGDGSFIAFGQNRILPPLSTNDTLATTMHGDVTDRNLTRSTDFATISRARYFNPVTGLALECGGTSCNNSADNMGVTTTLLDTTFTVGAAINDFYIGNSLILSDGMSELRIRNYFESDAGATVDERGSFLTAYNPADPNFSTNHTYVENILNTDPAYNVDADVAEWMIGRNRHLSFYNFGSTRTNGPGRYSMRLREGHASAQRWAIDNGYRCAVRIDD